MKGTNAKDRKKRYKRNKASILGKSSKTKQKQKYKQKKNTAKKLSVQKQKKDNGDKYRLLSCTKSVLNRAAPPKYSFLQFSDAAEQAE